MSDINLPQQAYWEGVLILAVRPDPSKIDYIQDALESGRRALVASGLDPLTFEEHIVWRQKRDAPGTPPPPIPPPPGHNFSPRNRQSVINLFFSVAPRFPNSGNGWDWVVRAGLADELGRDTPTKEEWREKVYAGPDIEALTLPDEHKAALIAAL